jgi:hypothetical protein
MSEMTRWIAERRGYRWLAKFTTRSFGYWQHVAVGDGQVKPRLDDYNTLKRIHDILKDDANLDSDIVMLLLEIMEHRGRMDAALARLINLIRHKAVKPDAGWRSPKRSGKKRPQGRPKPDSPSAVAQGTEAGKPETTASTN